MAERVRGWRRVVGWVIGVLLSLSIALALALQLRPVRSWLRDQLLTAVRGSLQGTLSIDDLRWPTLQYIELSGLSLADRQGHKVAGFSTLFAHLRLRSLLAGQLELERVELSDLSIDLADLGEQTGLLSVFESANPEVKAPAADSDMTPLPIVIRQLCVRRGTLRMTLPEGRKLSLVHMELCVRLRVQQSLQLALETLVAELRLNEARVAKLQARKDLPALGSAVGAGELAASLSGQLHVPSDGDLRFDVELQARGFSPATLRALGVDDATLRGPVDLDVHVVQLEPGGRGTVRYRSQLASAAGAISLTGELSAQRKLHAQLASSALSLSELTTLELPTLGFGLDADVALGEPERIDARIELLHGYYGAQALPRVMLEATRAADGGIKLTALHAEEGAAAVHGHGEWQPSGALQLDARWSVPELAKLGPVRAADPAWHGRVQGHVALRRGADQLFDARAELELAELGNASMTLGSARVTASLAGSLEAPRVRLEVHSERVHVSQRDVASVDLRLTGGPEHYLFEVEADRDFLRLDGWVERHAREWLLGVQGSSRLPQGPISVQVPMARIVPGETVELTQLRASFQGAQLMLDGKLDLQGSASQLRLAVTVPDLARLTEPFGTRAVPGRLELVGSLRGELARPALELKLHQLNGPKWEGHASDVDITLHADAAHGQADVALLARAGRARVTGHLESEWPKALSPSAALRRAKHDLTLELRQLSIPALLDPTNPAPQRVVDGLLDADISLQGQLSKLRIATHLRSQLRAARDPAELKLTADASYENERLELNVAATDRQGPLLALHAGTQLALERELQQPSEPRAWLRAARWELEAELSERSVYDLPLVRSVGAGEELAPLRAALHATVKHEPHAEPEANLVADVHWRDASRRLPVKSAASSAPRSVAPTAAVSCGDGVQGFLRIAGKWAQRTVGLDMRGSVGAGAAVGTGGAGAQAASAKGDSLRLAARMPLSFEQLISGQVQDLSKVQLAAEVQTLELQRIPWLCERAHGDVSLAIKAAAPLSKQAQLDVKVQTANLRWQDSAPLALTLDAHSEGAAMRVAADLQSGKGALHVRGRLPIDVHAAQPDGLLRRRDLLQLDLSLERVPMAALLAFVPDVARVSGVGSGEIHAFGTLDEPVVRGELQLDDVSLTLPRLGQRFAHVSARALLEEKSLRLSDVRMRDLGGSVSMAALLTWVSRDAWRAELNLNARNYPLRRTGVVMGHADVDARVLADMKPEQGHVDVALAKVAVELTNEGISNIQSLEPHPEFSYADALPAAEKPAPAKGQAKAAVPMTIHIASPEPLWVRRDDFAVQMQPDLNVVLGGEKPSIKGKIRLTRGYLSLLGQNFDIKRGEVVLSGGTEIDPQLTISATNTTPQGTVIRVEVTGFVTKPEIAFFIGSNPEPVSAGEALRKMNSRGSSDSTNFESEVASAALGMTMGLLSLGARREFGDWVPMLQIDPGQQTRVRVGVEAERFIPKFLRGFVRGAYVEGIVSAGSSDQSTEQTGTTTAGTTNTAAGSGVLLELTLPSNLVWAGQYGPGQAWSVDLNWRP